MYEIITKLMIQPYSKDLFSFDYKNINMNLLRDPHPCQIPRKITLLSLS